jgi:sigma-B regulation protein RsbU (phosphoserine phosphatase)
VSGLLHRALRSLRARLLAATILVAALALLVAGVAFERVASAVVTEAVRSHLAARAEEARDTVERFARERALAVRLWAQSEAMQQTLDSGDPKFAEDYLRRTVQDDVAVGAAALLDLDGRVVAAVRRRPGAVRRAEQLLAVRGVRIGSAPSGAALAGAANAAGIAPGRLVDPAAAEGPALVLASAVKDFTGEVVGAVVATLRADAVDRLLADVSGAHSAYVPLVGDAAGRIVFAPAGVDPAPWRPLLAGGEGGLHRLVAGGAGVLAARAAPGSAPPAFAAVMTVPERVAQEPLRRLRATLAVASGLVLVGAALAGGWALRRAARPLAEVAASLRRVADGDLSTRLPDGYGQELGLVARSFNGMVGEIERSRAQIASTESLRRELQIAREIQQSVLPAEVAVAGFEIAARMRPAENVGGDYFDVIERDGVLWLLVGDVSGHGVHSGLVMLMAQAAALGHIQRDPRCSPADVVAAVNGVLHLNVHRRMGRDEYLTLMAARHVGDGEFVAAGSHQPAFVARASGRQVEIVEPDGPWCGPCEDLQGLVPEYRFRVAEGDVLLLITDGMVEARDAGGALFGEERLAALLAGAPLDSARGALDAVLAGVDGFSARQDDDRTAVVVRRTARA